MKNGWKIERLGELVTFKTGKLNSNAAVADGKYPFFTCSQETFRTNTYSFDTECVLLAGNNADGVYPIKYFSGKFDAYQRTYVIKTRDPARLTTRFLFYCLQLQLSFLRSISTGAATKFLTLTILNDLEIAVPPIAVQAHIEGVLSAYDALIETDRSRIDVLEQMARAHYQEALEAGGTGVQNRAMLSVPYWQLISQNVSPYKGTKRYFATADVDGLAIRGKGIDYMFAEKPARAQKQPVPYSVWFARMKNTYKIAYYTEINRGAAEGSILSSGFAGFKALEAIFFPFMFLSITSREFHEQKDLFCSGATQMALTNTGLAQIQIPVPPEKMLRQLGERVLPILDLMLVLQERVDLLQSTRDILLPKLLFNEVGTPDVSEPMAAGVLV